jgi:hypothetical protein
VRGEEAQEKDEKDARRRSPKEWLELAEFGRKHHRRLATQQEELRRAAAMLSDEHAEFRSRVNRVILPGIQSDLEESRRLIRKAELYAEYSGRAAAKSQQTRKGQEGNRGRREDQR